MRMIHNKLRSRSGETLVEVLVAMMIIALSVMLLVTMVTTAGSIDIAVRGNDDGFYGELSDAETRQNPKDTAKMKIKINDPAATEIPAIEVNLYGENRVTSYAKGAD